jgi:hypothetical protein
MSLAVSFFTGLIPNPEGKSTGSWRPTALHVERISNYRQASLV